jgi:GDPmannose 4,6-dehydratase
MDEASDYLVATGVSHSVRQCLEIAFDQAGIDIDDHVVIDESLKRPAEVDHLIGDSSKAERRLEARHNLRADDRHWSTPTTSC